MRKPRKPKIQYTKWIRRRLTKRNLLFFTGSFFIILTIATLVPSSNRFEIIDDISESDILVETPHFRLSTNTGTFEGAGTWEWQIINYFHDNPDNEAALALSLLNPSGDFTEIERDELVTGDGNTFKLYYYFSDITTLLPDGETVTFELKYFDAIAYGNDFKDIEWLYIVYEFDIKYNAATKTMSVDYRLIEPNDEYREAYEQLTGVHWDILKWWRGNPVSSSRTTIMNYPLNPLAYPFEFFFDLAIVVPKLQKTNLNDLGSAVESIFLIIKVFIDFGIIAFSVIAIAYFPAILMILFYVLRLLLVGFSARGPANWLVFFLMVIGIIALIVFTT